MPALSKLFRTTSQAEAHGRPIRFSWQEVAAALVKSQGITKGHWQVGANLLSEAANLTVGEGAVRPGVMTVFDHFMLIPVSAPTPLSVDAEALSVAH